MSFRVQCYDIELKRVEHQYAIVFPCQFFIQFYIQREPPPTNYIVNCNLCFVVVYDGVFPDESPAYISPVAIIPFLWPPLAVIMSTFIRDGSYVDGQEKGR